MIKKISDKSILSGVTSPLLPLIYCDAFVGCGENDGLYVAQNSDGDNTSFFSVKNGRAVFGCFSKDSLEEVLLFLSFNGVNEIISLLPISPKQKELPLMHKKIGNGNLNEKSEKLPVLYLSETSNFSEYRKLSYIVGDDVGESFDFSVWYRNLSTKIVSSNALFNYITDGENILAYSCVNALYNESAIISGVYTKPQYRGKGFAKDCLESLFCTCVRVGVKDVYLWCENKNIPFYEKAGFENAGKIYIGECL